MPDITYQAQVASPLLNGEASLSLSTHGLSITALFDALELPFSQINALTSANYQITIQSDAGQFTLSKLGNWHDPFYQELSSAYNQAVLRSLFITGDPLITAQGIFNYDESAAQTAPNSPSSTGQPPAAPTAPTAPASTQPTPAAAHVYQNCVVALPPNLGARRIPLCFLAALTPADYSLTLTLDTGEHYTLAKLGYNQQPFQAAIQQQLLQLRQRTLDQIMQIDPSLTPAQSQQIARLMPLGAAAPLGQLTAIAPSFTAALQQLLAQTRAAQTFKALQQLCDPTQIYVGFKKLDPLNDEQAAPAAETPPAPGGDIMASAVAALTGGAGGISALSEAAGDAASPDGSAAADDTAEEEAPAPFLLWLIAPSPDGRYATVEFAESDTATFVYRTRGNFEAFAKQLNRSLEAINFKREVIRLSDEELLQPQNADYLMAAKRTTALSFIRSNYTGRIIHTTLETWQQKLQSLWK